MYTYAIFTLYPCVTASLKYVLERIHSIVLCDPKKFDIIISLNVKVGEMCAIFPTMPIMNVRTELPVGKYEISNNEYAIILNMCNIRR